MLSCLLRVPPMQCRYSVLSFGDSIRQTFTFCRTSSRHPTSCSAWSRISFILWNNQKALIFDLLLAPVLVGDKLMASTLKPCGRVLGVFKLSQRHLNTACHCRNVFKHSVSVLKVCLNIVFKQKAYMHKPTLFWNTGCNHFVSSASFKHHVQTPFLQHQLA